MENTNSNSLIFDMSIFSTKEFTNEIIINKKKSKEIYASIVLNMPFKEIFANNILNNSDLLICADGAANRIYDYNQSIIPGIIAGDFDSIRSDVKEYYTKKDVNMILRKDTRTSDFEKCLYILLEKVSDLIDKSEESDLCLNIIVFGASGGKIDHTFNNYFLLSRYAIKLRELIRSKIFICGENSLSIMLNNRYENLINLTEFSDCKSGFSIFSLFSSIDLTISEKSSEKRITKFTNDLNLDKSEYVDSNYYSKELF